MAISEFQLAMLGAGGVFVAAVWGYNKWQERKHRRLADRVFKGQQPDVLLGNDTATQAPPVERREPSGDDETDIRREPVLGGGDAAVPAEDGIPPLPEFWADSISDCAIRVEFATPHAAPALWAVQAAWAQQLSKPLAWFGFDAEERRWHRVDAYDASSYTVWVGALQLADRQGSVADTELALFVEGVHRLAEQFDGEVELPPRHEVIAHAQALDKFCASVDVQLGVNVVAAPGAVIGGTKLRGVAEASGFSLGDDGVYHAYDENGAALFTLANMSGELFVAETMKSINVAGVVLTLDVPRVANGVEIFDRMVAAARQLAQSVDGSVVDAQRHVLSDEIVASIRAKIGEIQQRMVVHRIVAGGPRALRLFV